MSEGNPQDAYKITETYNDTRIILLPKDPNCLFAYWEISDEKKINFCQEFGQELWERSVPVIKLSNISKDTSFFIKINDFSNNWYINVEDSDSMYTADLGRLVSDQFFISLASSNYSATPSNTISSNTSAYFINYNDLKNGRLNVESGKIYETYNLKAQSQPVFGISSQELFGINIHELVSGISSNEFFGAKVKV